MEYTSNATKLFQDYCTCAVCASGEMGEQFTTKSNAVRRLPRTDKITEKFSSGHREPLSV